MHLTVNQGVRGSIPRWGAKKIGIIMVARNDITGDSIQTKTATQSYRDNYDNIFKKPDPRDVQDALNEDEEFKRIEEMQKR